MSTFDTCTVTVCSGLLLFSSALVSQNARITARPHRAAAVSVQNRALASLARKTAYLCPVRPPLKDFEASYAFSNTEDGSGTLVEPTQVPDYFGSKQAVIILYARKKSEFYIDLRLKNSLNNAQTTLSVSVDKTWVRDSFDGVTGNGFLSKTPVPALPRIGMTRLDVDCIMGFPDETNSDALGGDQLVYRHSHVYVYISPRTDKVVNIQTSY